MQVLLRRCVILLVLGAMLGGHVTELFDHWDHTLQTGKDIDYSLVVVAACLGVAFVAIRELALVLRRLLAANTQPISEPLLATDLRSIPEISVCGPSPPIPIPVRI